MNFCIYSDYEITVKNEYCYINEEGDHTTEVEEFTKTMDGGKLAEFIAKLLLDKEFSSVSLSDNHILISTFNPLDGTGSDIQISIKGLENER